MVGFVTELTDGRSETCVVQYFYSHHRIEADLHSESAAERIDSDDALICSRSVATTTFPCIGISHTL